MSVTYSGSCNCNQVELYLSLPEFLSSYSPRACDCDFCTRNDIVFLSDPMASLALVSTISIDHITQGSQQAEFLRCVNCEQVVAVIAYIDGTIKGAVNSDCLYDSALLATATPVSAQSLTPAERKIRWSQLWMPVSLSEPD